MRRMRHKGLLIAGLVIAALAVAVFFAPYKSWLEAKLKSDLADAGLGALQFSVGDVNLRGITLNDVTLYGQRLESLTLGYSPFEIVQGNFRNLNASNMALKQGRMTVGLREVSLAVSPDATKKQWSGPWAVKAIVLQNFPVDVPPLEGVGTLTRDDGAIQLQGEIASADKQFRAVFKLDYPMEDSAKAVFTLSSLVLPWNGGVVSLKNVTVPIFGEKPIKFALGVKAVSLDKVMSGATGDKASATGTISGAVPVTINRDGTFSLQAGTLKADGVGKLTLSPDLIPGDNAQVQIVRDVMKDFHYDVFSMAVENGDNKKLSILLSLSGNNPDVYNGREINLNVHLGGDVIQLLTQSVMLLNDPQQLLRQEKHDK